MRFTRCLPLLCLGLLLTAAVLAQTPVVSPQATATSPGTPQKGGIGDLTILPTRIVLEGRTRAAEVMLKNAGQVQATYRILLQEMEMTSEGQLQVRSKGEGEITAANLIRYSPHQVELAPGEAQIIRIQVRKPDNLPDGEYRSHMVFQGIPPAEVPVTTDPMDAKQGISISIKPIYGISIPIIVRSGETTATLNIANLNYLQATKDGYRSGVTLELQRQGNRSVIGDLELTVDSGSTLKKGTVVGQSKGVAVYQTIPFRKVGLPLEIPKGQSLKGAKLKVTFTFKDIKLPPVQGFLDLP